MAKRSLAKNRAIWDNAQIQNYRMKVRIMKTGHAAPMGSVIFEVKDGNAVSMTRVPNEWLGGEVERCAPYNTVPKIFDKIASEIGGDVLDVTYDSTLGYPTKVNIDPNRWAIDDELSWEVLQFEKL